MDGDAALDFASTVGPDGTMQFLHPGGTLEVQGNGTFGELISGFAVGDTIDAARVETTGAVLRPFVGIAWAGQVRPAKR